MMLSRPLNVLIGCERSGKIREAFRKRGHNAWSNDLESADDGSPFHLQEDVRRVLRRRYMTWDLFIVHPECTFLSSSGLHWNKRGRMVDGRPRAELTEEALQFAIEMFEADVPHIVGENPIGCISTRYRKPDQIIQPWQYGDDASKATCLWLKDMPLLVPTKFVAPRYVCQDCWRTTKGCAGSCPRCGSIRVRERWANQTDSGQNVLPPSDDRRQLRSETYPGIADAMAVQYEAYLTTWRQAA